MKMLKVDAETHLKVKVEAAKQNITIMELVKRMIEKETK